MKTIDTVKWGPGFREVLACYALEHYWIIILKLHNSSCSKQRLPKFKDSGDFLLWPSWSTNVNSFVRLCLPTFCDVDRVPDLLYLNYSEKFWMRRIILPLRWIASISSCIPRKVLRASFSFYSGSKDKNLSNNWSSKTTYSCVVFLHFFSSFSFHGIQCQQDNMLPQPEGPKIWLAPPNPPSHCMKKRNSLWIVTIQTSLSPFLDEAASGLSIETVTWTVSVVLCAEVTATVRFVKVSESIPIQYKRIGGVYLVKMWFLPKFLDHATLCASTPNFRYLAIMNTFKKSDENITLMLGNVYFLVLTAMIQIPCGLLAVKKKIKARNETMMVWNWASYGTEVILICRIAPKLEPSTVFWH